MTLIYTPRVKNSYFDTYERYLYDYFVNTLGWGEQISDRASFEFLIEARDFSKGKTILDAGAGYKRFEPFFRDANYLSLEHPSGIELKAMQGVSYDIVAELDADIFTEKASIDVIYSHSVLEHIARPEKFFSNSFQVLKPGGRLYINAPFIYPEHEQPFDFNRFSRYGLKSRLEEAGFNIIKLVPSSNAIYSASCFLIPALHQEEISRGFRVADFTLPDGSVTPLLPLLSSIIESLNNLFDDAIYESNSSIGWLCIAERPLQHH